MLSGLRRASVFAIVGFVAVLAAQVATAGAGPSVSSLDLTANTAGSAARVGTNLADIGPASSAGVVFVDAMKQAAPWSSRTALRIDSDGNVTVLAPGQAAQTVIFPAEAYPSGDYALLYDGRGSFAVDAGSGSIVQHQPGRIILRLTERLGYGIRLRLTATDPRDYARNIRLILPGFEPTYARAPFHPLFLKSLAPYCVLRFSRWMRADSNVASAPWPARSAVTALTQSGPGGVAVEYLVALANATGADPWFTFPMGVTNLYVVQFAARVHALLDPRLHPYFEYGEAAWQPGTATNAYAAMAGGNFRLAPDARTAAVAWYAARSTQMFGLVRNVYGADAGRIVRVLSGPLAVTPADAALDREILAGAGRADAFAVSADTGMGAAWAPAVQTALPAVLGGLEQRLRKTGLLGAAFARTTRLAQAAGLPTIAYQGGPASELSRFAAAGPAVRQAASDTLEAWHANGGGLFVLTLPAGSTSAANTAPGVVDYLLRHVREAPSGSSLLVGRAAPAVSFTPSSAAARFAFARGFAAPAAAHPLGISIDAGGGAAGAYVADTDFSGGSHARAYSGAIETSGVANPAPAAVYQTARYAPAFHYVISGLTPGAWYAVRLHFAENFWSAAGKRVFNVTLTGTTATLTGFDIYAQAGAAHKAVAVPFSNVVASGSGTITISFTTTKDNALVNGIEVAANPTPTPTPLPTATPTPTSAPPAADYLTYHSDNLRTGWSPNETLLNTANVASANFALQTTIPVDGDVLAQPLYVANYPVPGSGNRNLLIVATENDSVYAFDADTAALIWLRSMGPAQASSEIGDSVISPSYGITGTPVIVRSSPSSATIYLIAATDEPAGSRNFHTRLHALDAGTGTDQLPPVEIAATATLNNGTQVHFNPARQMSRPGLLWANGSLYAAFGAHGDAHMNVSFGWLLRYGVSAAGMSQIGSFITTADATAAYQSSIWMAGFAPAADAAGNVYFATGNGAYDANTSGGANFGESVVKVAPDLSRTVDFFTPQDWASLNTNDLDFGSGGVMLLPAQPNPAAPDLAVIVGKTSQLFLLNADHLGGVQAGDAGALQTFQDTGSGLWGGPAYYDNGAGGHYVYFQTASDYLRAYAVSSSGTPALTQSSVSTQTRAYSGTLPVVSSNGSTAGSAIVWVVQRRDSRNANGLNVVLEAYDASNVARRLYRGTAGTWGTVAGRHNGFLSPLVANGRVYVGATKSVDVFGVLPGASAIRARYAHAKRNLLRGEDRFDRAGAAFHAGKGLGILLQREAIGHDAVHLHAAVGQTGDRRRIHARA